MLTQAITLTATLQTEYCPKCGEIIDMMFCPNHGYIYPIPECCSTSHNEPCDEPAIYHVEIVK
jgi:predicted RNA-binding Zn-ribbon protein involved in translation (DUF1610 family)